MKISTIRKYKKKHRLAEWVKAIKRNPAVFLGISLPFAIATAISLKSAVAMSIEFISISIVTAAVSVLSANKLPYWVRAAVNVGVATVVMMAARNLVTYMIPEVSNYLGTYLYLMALSGRAQLEAATVSPKRRVRFGAAMKKSLTGALKDSVIFVFLMLALAVPREYFGSGTIWGRSLPSLLKLNGMLMPFYGFVTAGFLIAAVKFFFRSVDILGVREAERGETREREGYSQIVVKK